MAPAAAAPAGVTGACAGKRLGEPAPSLLPPLLVVRRWWRASADVRGPFMGLEVWPGPAAAAEDCAPGAAACRGPLRAEGSASNCCSCCGAGGLVLLSACKETTSTLEKQACPAVPHGHCSCVVHPFGCCCSCAVGHGAVLLQFLAHLYFCL